MPKCDFNKVAKLAWVFSCKFAAYFQNTFSQEQLWVAASACKSYQIIAIVGVHAAWSISRKMRVGRLPSDYFHEHV